MIVFKGGAEKREKVWRKTDERERDREWIAE